MVPVHYSLGFRLEDLDAYGGRRNLLRTQRTELYKVYTMYSMLFLEASRRLLDNEVYGIMTAYFLAFRRSHMKHCYLAAASPRSSYVDVSLTEVGCNVTSR